MRADDEAQVEAVVVAILDHLRTHPLAADSVDGVARWWLGPAQASATLQQVERALERLVTRGVMRKLRLMDGTWLYSQALPQRQ
jgi:hypothetical protein